MKPNLEQSRKHGVEELDTLRTMVLAWRESYFGLAPPKGGSDYLFLCNEFTFEIEEHIYPYVRRMLITQHIDPEQVAIFMDFCFQQVRDLQAYLLKMKNHQHNGD